MSPLFLLVSSTPLPVQVVALPGPDNYVRASVIIALFVLAAASATLWRVNTQIGIARKELRAVQDDFNLAQDKFDEVTRRPDIKVEGRLDYEKGRRPNPEGASFF